MARFSIIVPLVDSRNHANQFEDTLASILRYRPSSTQVIVAHQGNYTNPHSLGSDEVEFVTTKRTPHLIRLMNCGLREATGQYVSIVRPGVELDEGWHEIVSKAMVDRKIGCVAPALVDPSRPTKLVACGVSHDFGMTRKLVGVDARRNPEAGKKLKPLGPTSWAAFYRKDALDEVGSFDETLDSNYVDLDIALALKQVGYRCAFRPALVANVSHARKIIRESQTAHGRSAQRGIRRHSTSSAFTGLVAAVSDVLQTPFRPWGLQHALQRTGAWRTADIDTHFRAQLEQAASQRRRASESILPFRKPLEAPTEQTRRAA